MSNRSELKINDLKQRRPSAARLMNVKIPVAVAEGIERMAKELQVSKTEVVIALLNEGLDHAKKALKG